MFRPCMTWLSALALACAGTAGCKSDEAPQDAGGTTSGSTTTGPNVDPDTSSESTGSPPVTTAEDTSAEEGGPGSIACGAMLCSEGLLCVREVTHSDMGEPVSEWFCRSKPETCGDEPGDCACAAAVCYNSPCSCQDTGPNRFTCTNDGTCGSGDDTTTGASTDTGGESSSDSSTSG